MAIQIRKTFEVETAPAEVWAFLVTPERVVECLPGARIVQAIDERTYEGEIGVRIGPIGATFRGTIRFDELDEENLRVEMSGQGNDRQGTGSVTMSMSSTLEPRPDGGTRVSVLQTVSLSGKLASFGRGGVIQSVADFMFGRFVNCMQQKLASPPGLRDRQ